MSFPEILVYVLTALAVVAIALTRLRLSRGGGGRLRVGRGLLNVHTIFGVLALLVWTTFLVAPEDSALGSELTGILALGLWWVVVVAGLMFLLRWMPTRGRHAAEGTADNWSRGPGLSVLAHVGMLLGVCYFSFAYLTSIV